MEIDKDSFNLGVRQAQLVLRTAAEHMPTVVIYQGSIISPHARAYLVAADTLEALIVP